MHTFIITSYFCRETRIMFTDLNNDKHVYLQNEQAAETEANGASV